MVTAGKDTSSMGCASVSTTVIVGLSIHTVKKWNVVKHDLMIARKFSIQQKTGMIGFPVMHAVWVVRNIRNFRIVSF